MSLYTWALLSSYVIVHPSAPLSSCYCTVKSCQHHSHLLSLYTCQHHSHPAIVHLSASPSSCNCTPLSITVILLLYTCQHQCHLVIVHLSAPQLSCYCTPVSITVTLLLYTVSITVTLCQTTTYNILRVCLFNQTIQTMCKLQGKPFFKQLTNRKYTKETMRGMKFNLGELSFSS